MTCLFCWGASWGQKIEINKYNKQLNVLLNEIIEEHDLLLSYDEQFMSSIRLKGAEDCESVADLFSHIVQHYPITIDTIGNNIIFKKREKLRKPIVRNYIFEGRVFDSNTNAGLPNALITVGDYTTYSSSTGHFTVKSKLGKQVAVVVRHLGYDGLDTLAIESQFMNIPLRYQAISLSGITVDRRRSLTHNAHVGSKPGAIKLNPAFIKKLPGYGESSIYNFLRLMPGVLATGENSNDMSIRGSVEGQNVYVFDNYRVYNPWYKLNEIGTINPLLVKDIEVYKSGYDASKGENVGGFVELTGQNAIPEKTSLDMYVNNFLANVKSEIVLSDKTALIIAARNNLKQTIQKSSDSNYTYAESPRSGQDLYDINAEPDYTLKDGNIKLIHQYDENRAVSFSSFLSYDEIVLNDYTTTADFAITNNQKRYNFQRAASLDYYWHKESGARGEFIASYSSIKSYNKMAAIYSPLNVLLDSEHNNSTDNSRLEEFRAEYKHQISLSKSNSLEYGLGATTSNIVGERVVDTTRAAEDLWHHLGYLYGNVKWNVLPNLVFSGGGRIDYSTGTEKITLEPRAQLNYYMNDRWKLYGSFGVFRQFTYKSNYSDYYGNTSFRWVRAGRDTPHLISQKACLGVRYNNEKWMFSTELFNNGIRNKVSNIIKGQGMYSWKEDWRYWGADALVKYDDQRLTSWIAYTFSDFKLRNTNYSMKERYRTSDFNMKHEVKWAATYNLNKFNISASYVYGYGFKFWRYHYNGSDKFYSRLDLGAFYDLELSGNHVEVGVSLLNILDNKNRKMDEFTRFGIGDAVISYPVSGLRFTPAFFIKISL
ncbi:hypothetical protein EYV94_25570 [Puteibacter caeruleilacunae]|nr:hypothetical protein EYV94_25570 [Puteibacter caeruleilacunae]